MYMYVHCHVQASVQYTTRESIAHYTTVHCSTQWHAARIGEYLVSTEVTIVLCTISNQDSCCADCSHCITVSAAIAIRASACCTSTVKAHTPVSGEQSFILRSITFKISSLEQLRRSVFSVTQQQHKQQHHQHHSNLLHNWKTFLTIQLKRTSNQTLKNAHCGIMKYLR